MPSSATPLPSSPGGEDQDYDSALHEGWLPIREIARRTGVNAVTLRAWERRYGLLVPKRTPKGHRLYSEAHVVRVQQVLAWIARGVAVSQVKGLLDEQRPAVLPSDTPWQGIHREMMDAIGRLASRSLDEAYNRAASLYPPRVLLDQLLAPLLRELERLCQATDDGRLQQVFFHTWLRSKLGARIYHSQHSLRGAPLVLLNLDETPMNASLWLCAWLISAADCPVELVEWSIPASNLDRLVEQLKPRALILCRDSRPDSELRRQLHAFANRHSLPCLTLGALGESLTADAAPARGPGEAFDRLQSAGLLRQERHA
ncbi:MerR family transcriptional regulator [Pseudomonas oryzihabitans]|uniref:MerR family transcriptional regulator n=1 Tax=Pseudomonas oryzihabitans TaxID=47885 RepID=UPI00289383D1|nr:MerR family transcriptional regulator [Pseudomonas oryzihabitans]MDT3719253.1 MerR family transcriptional regulator [Pseudomonas oryzihabitans]